MSVRNTVPVRKRVTGFLMKCQDSPLWAVSCIYAQILMTNLLVGDVIIMKQGFC